MRLIFLLAFALSACSSRPPVRCDKHLQPINAPAAKQGVAANVVHSP